MSKTPEEMAEEYAAIRSIADESVVLGANPWTKEAFLAGYKAGQEITEQEIADIIFDIRKREEDERKKLPMHKQQRHDRIWEKIKVKLIGIL